MKTVVIVDDEEDARKLLRFYIAQHPALAIIGEAADGLEAVRMIRQLTPDTVFLDVQMPGLNGFEVLTQLEEIPEVVFTTAYDQYAIKAFEVHALDYLLKPYGKSRFENALARILRQQDRLLSLTESLLSRTDEFPEKIILHKGSRKIWTSVSDLIYLEAYGDYTKVFTKKEELLSTKGIQRLVENLNPQLFLRLHRSHFVHKDQLLELRKVDRYYYAILSNGVQLKISESYLPAIKRLLF